MLSDHAHSGSLSPPWQVWGLWNGMRPRDAELLRRAADRQADEVDHAVDEGPTLEPSLSDRAGDGRGELASLADVAVRAMHASRESTLERKISPPYRPYRPRVFAHTVPPHRGRRTLARDGTRYRNRGE